MDSWQAIYLRSFDVPECDIQKLEKRRINQDWPALCTGIATSRTYMGPVLEAYFDIIPDEYKYNLLVSCHVSHGDGIPSIRKRVRLARRYGSPTFPEELDGVQEITVYRAGDEDITLAPYRLSWTIDRDMAIHFFTFSGFNKKSHMHLYEGTINRDKVIAYTNERSEYEIIQYRNVKNIKQIGYATREQAERLYLTQDKTELLRKCGIEISA